MKKPSCLEDVSLPVFLLVIVFALSSWIDFYGLFIEMPLFVNYLPEGWALPSYITMVAELAGIAPLSFVIAVKLCPGKIKEWPFIMIIIGVGATMCLCLVFLWDKTAYIVGQQRSVGLLSICAVLTLVDCTSTVVYIPYMARFKTQYLTAYYIGEGLGSLIPGLVGLAQGVGSEARCVNFTSVTLNDTTGNNVAEWSVQAVYKPPLFSVEVYLLFLCGIMIFSGIAFIILHRAPFVRKEYNQQGVTADDKTNNNLGGGHELEQLQKKDSANCVETSQATATDRPLQVVIAEESSKKRFVLLLLLNGYLCLIQYSILPTIAPYSTIPYGNIVYNLFARLFSVVIPLSAVFCLIHSTTSLRTQFLITIVSSGLVGYHLFLASCSPTPPLHGTTIGGFLSVGTGLLSATLSQYTIVTISAVLKESRGRMGLLWFGAATQTGAFIGALLMYILINVAEVFAETPPC